MKTITTPRFEGILYLKPEEVRPALEIYVSRLKQHGYEPQEIKELTAVFYTNKIITKYTNEQEDNMLNYWIKMIHSGPEGFKQAMNYALANTPTFEHRKSRGAQSYEKGNVSRKTRKQEKPWEFKKKPKKERGIKTPDRFRRVD